MKTKDEEKWRMEMKINEDWASTKLKDPSFIC